MSVAGKEALVMALDTLKDVGSNYMIEKMRSNQQQKTAMLTSLLQIEMANQQQNKEWMIQKGYSLPDHLKTGNLDEFIENSGNTPFSQALENYHGTMQESNEYISDMRTRYNAGKVKATDLIGSGATESRWYPQGSIPLPAWDDELIETAQFSDAEKQALVDMEEITGANYADPVYMAGFTSNERNQEQAWQFIEARRKYEETEKLWKYGNIEEAEASHFDLMTTTGQIIINAFDNAKDQKGQAMPIFVKGLYGLLGSEAGEATWGDIDGEGMHSRLMGLKNKIPHIHSQLMNTMIAWVQGSPIEGVNPHRGWIDMVAQYSNINLRMNEIMRNNSGLTMEQLIEGNSEFRELNEIFNEYSMIGFSTLDPSIIEWASNVDQQKLNIATSKQNKFQDEMLDMVSNLPYPEERISEVLNFIEGDKYQEFVTTANDAVESAYMDAGGDIDGVSLYTDADAEGDIESILPALSEQIDVNNDGVIDVLDIIGQIPPEIGNTNIVDSDSVSVELEGILNSLDLVGGTVLDDHGNRVSDEEMFGIEGVDYTIPSYDLDEVSIATQSDMAGPYNLPATSLHIDGIVDDYVGSLNRIEEINDIVRTDFTINLEDKKRLQLERRALKNIWNKPFSVESIGGNITSIEDFIKLYEQRKSDKGMQLGVPAFRGYAPGEYEQEHGFNTGFPPEVVPKGGAKLTSLKEQLEQLLRSLDMGEYIIAQ